MTPAQYKARLFALLEQLKQHDIPAHEREAIAEEIKEMIEALIPD